MTNQIGGSQNIIQADYSSLEKIANHWGDCSHAVARHYSLINEHICRLKRQNWEGDAAERFYGTMDQDVLPALTRLAKSFECSETTLFALIRLFQQADLEASYCVSQDGGDGFGNHMYRQVPASSETLPQQGEGDDLERINNLLALMESEGLSDEQFVELMGLIQKQERNGGNPQDWQNEREAILEYLDEQFAQEFGMDISDISELELTDDNKDIYGDFVKNYLILEANVPDASTAVALLWHAIDSDFETEAMAWLGEGANFIGGWGPSPDVEEVVYGGRIMTDPSVGINGDVAGINPGTSDPVQCENNIVMTQDDCETFFETRDGQIILAYAAFFGDNDSTEFRTTGDLLGTYLEETGHSWQEYYIEHDNEQNIRQDMAFEDTLSYGPGMEYQIKRYMLSLDDAGIISLSDEKRDDLIFFTEPPDGVISYADVTQESVLNPLTRTKLPVHDVPDYPIPEDWVNGDNWIRDAK